jgi:hypothetical protein
VEWKCDAELRLVRVLQKIMRTFDVMYRKTCSLESSKYSSRLESRQMLAHASSGSAMDLLLDRL